MLEGWRHASKSNLRSRIYDYNAMLAKCAIKHILKTYVQQDLGK